MKKFEVDAECRACGGTGLYIGMAERHGAAVVCSRCKGTGKERMSISYIPFTGRKKRMGVVRVFEFNSGYVIGNGPDCKIEDFGGMSFDKWEQGEPFPLGSESREYVCPKQYAQVTGKDFDYEKCKYSLGTTFKNCKFYVDKKECWRDYDKQKTNHEAG